MKTDKNDVVNQIISDRILPLIVCEDLDVAKTLCEITLKSGYKLIEFGIRYENSIENYEIISKYLKKNFSEFYLGVGSISNLEGARKVMDIGVDFIVGPGLNYDIAKDCKKNKICYIPGCATITEIISANDIGCELIKIFPADLLGGPKYLKTIMAPLPWLKAIPAGGILSEPENIKEWLNIGAEAVTLGSDLYKKNNNKYSIEEIKSKLNYLHKEICKKTDKKNI